MSNKEKIKIPLDVPDNDRIIAHGIYSSFLKDSFFQVCQHSTWHITLELDKKKTLRGKNEHC